MESNETKGKSPGKIKPELLVALIAVFISFSTLFVYIYQSNLMKEQQKMSVWPYLGFGPSWGYDYLSLRLTNKGIGPAIIKDIKLEIDGVKIDGVEKIMDFVPDTLQTPFTFSSLFVGSVIMSGEITTFFEVKNPKTVDYILNEIILKNRITLEICYASVYGETWMTNGIKVVESKCDKKN